MADAYVVDVLYDVYFCEVATDWPLESPVTPKRERRSA